MSTSVRGFVKGSVSIKAIIGIALVAGIYHFAVQEFVNEDELSFADFSFGTSSLAVGIASLIIAKRYAGSEVFGKTYFALGLGFVVLFVGDIVYNYYLFVLEEDPYPSIADVFFIGFYAFAGYHLIKNIIYFKKDLSAWHKLQVVIVAAAMVLGFGLFTLETLTVEATTYWMSMAYLVSSAIILALAILAFIVFRNSVLAIAWGLLVIGIFLYSVADIWYYYLEEIGEFSIKDPVNTLWVLSNAIMVYALYEHKKIL